MKFCLYGRVQGARAVGTSTTYATVRHQFVMDMSVSARRRGIKVGLSVVEAKALVPELELLDDPDTPSPQMEVIWRTLVGFSPWIRTVDANSFYLQIAGQKPPLREVRDILLRLDEGMSTEQRAAVTFAETPFLARTLFAMGQVSRLPQSMYRKVRRQTLLIAKSLSQGKDGEVQLPTWVGEVPTQALWFLAKRDRDMLQRLHIQTLDELLCISTSELMQQFGRRALAWSRIREIAASSLLEVNYPPRVYTETWQAALGTTCAAKEVQGLLQPLAANLSRRLLIDGVGATKMQLVWQTEGGREERTRSVSVPMADSQHVLASIRGFVAEAEMGQPLIAIEISILQVQVLTAIQSGFLVRETALYPNPAPAEEEMETVVAQVNERFPNRLQRGLAASFRERRMESMRLAGSVSAGYGR